MSKLRTTAELLQDSLWAGQNMGTLMSQRDALICCLAEGVSEELRRRPEPPEPECEADGQILLLLGERAWLHWGLDVYDWRAAQIASWSVPIACCVKCNGDEYASGGLTCRHTTHRQCWPEAWDEHAECRCPAHYRCSPWPSPSEDIAP